LSGGSQRSSSPTKVSKYFHVARATVLRYSRSSFVI